MIQRSLILLENADQCMDSTKLFYMYTRVHMGTFRDLNILVNHTKIAA